MKHRPCRILLEGVDGTGKSTLAHEMALHLTEIHPAAVIRVTDSNGRFTFRNGESPDHTFHNLEHLKPSPDDGRVAAITHLGLFTLGRRLINARPGAVDMLISVRDPHRIDPAAYMAVYGGALGRLSPQARLQILDLTTAAPYADAIVHLHASENTLPMLTPLTSPHEAPEHLDTLTQEIPRIVGAYSRLYGTRVYDIPARTSATTGLVVAATAAHLHTLRSA